MAHGCRLELLFMFDITEPAFVYVMAFCSIGHEAAFN